MKLQAPTSKLQRTSNNQASKFPSALGAWGLEFLWSLDVGIWSFSLKGGRT
jgi:hypothetical protein